jgi:hypothetical protein
LFYFWSVAISKTAVTTLGEGIDSCGGDSDPEVNCERRERNKEEIYTLNWRRLRLLRQFPVSSDCLPEPCPALSLFLFPFDGYDYYSLAISLTVIVYSFSFLFSHKSASFFLFFFFFFTKLVA